MAGNMIELHNTSKGWVPVDVPGPPVCYDSTSEPDNQQTDCRWVGGKYVITLAPKEQEHERCRANPAQDND